MFTIGHFFIGIFIVALGVLMVKYSYQVVGFTGRQVWIESKLGQGTTYFVYKMFGVLAIFGGFIYAVGLYNSFMFWLFTPLRHLLGAG